MARVPVPANRLIPPRRLFRSAGVGEQVLRAGFFLALVGWVDPALRGRILIVGLAVWAAGTDIFARRVSNRLLLAGIPAALWSVGLGGLKVALVGAGIFGGLSLLVRILSRSRLGAGDVKLGTIFGFLLGPTGACLAFAVANVLALVMVVAGALLRRRWPRDGLPFAPYLGIGAMAVAWLPRLLRR